LTFNHTGAGNDITGTGGTWSVTQAGGASFTTLTSTGNSTLGTSNTALANSFGTGANAASVINTIGSTGAGSTTTINGETELSNTQPTGGGEVRTNYTLADATSDAGQRATGNYTLAISNSGGLSFPTATGVLGDAQWNGGANGTDQIIGVEGETHPGSGITALGVVGEADQTNAAGNTGVLGFADLGTTSNVGVAGTANATQAQLVTFEGGLPSGFSSGIVGYNATALPAANTYAGYFAGDVGTTGHVLTTSTITAAVTSTGDASAATAAGSDVAGTVSFTDGAGGVGGTLTVTFANAYASAPTVVITPANDNPLTRGMTTWYVTEVAGGFTITYNDAGGAAGAMAFNYIVIH